VGGCDNIPCIANQTQFRNRRCFLRFLAQSPLLAAAAQQSGGVISDPKSALNVMDFEAVARQALPPAHWGYLATGVDDDATVAANREGFRHLQLRPRRLVDVSHTELRTNLFGATYESPIWIAPVGSQKAFHPEGELAVARAAKNKGSLVVLSTNTTTPIERVAESAGRPIWYQLYTTNSWPITEKLVRHADRAGCPVLVLTVDQPVGRNTETLERFKRMDTRDCKLCHVPDQGFRRKPMFDGIDMKGVNLNQSAMTWDVVRKLKDLTAMKLVLKGIETREDAQLCCETGVDGIIVSNHGGRETEAGRATIDSLPEVLNGVAGRIPVLVDGGFRRGTDIIKALALGARAVGIGRPYVWGLAGFGQPGVERVVDLLRAELELVMRQCGSRSPADLTPALVLKH
jgi:4-hydroxymandelate oxidase